MKTVLTVALVCLLSLPAHLQATSLSADMGSDYDDLEPRFIHFHQNPELSVLVTQTAAPLARELQAAGFDVHEAGGGTPASVRRSRHCRI